MIAQKTGVAFSLDADAFIAFVRSLPGGINSPSDQPLQIGDIVDFDMCWAYNLADPWAINTSSTATTTSASKPSSSRRTVSNGSATGRVICTPGTESSSAVTKRRPRRHAPRL